MSDKQSWLRLEETQKLKELIEKTKRDFEVMLGAGTTIGERADSTSIATAKVVGSIYGFESVLNYLQETEEEETTKEEVSEEYES